MLCGRLFRHIEDTGTFSSYLNHPGFYCKFTMTGFMCQMPVIFRKRSTLASPAFKSRPQCHIFLWHRDFMRRCVCHRSESVLLYGIFWFWHKNRPFLHKQRITGNYLMFRGFIMYKRYLYSLFIHAVILL